MNLRVAFDSGVQSSPYSRRVFRKKIKELQTIIARERHFSKIIFSDSAVATIIITTDKVIKKLNSEFRNKNEPTDVLTFSNIGIELGEPKTHLGEIYISETTARRQARHHKVTLTAELILLAVHGLVHLSGLDHEKSDKEYQKSRKKEVAILTSLGMPHVRPLTGLEK